MMVVWMLLNPIISNAMDSISGSPLQISPQFPFHLFYTLFDPDSAELIKTGKVQASVGFIQTNIISAGVNSFLYYNERDIWDSGQFKICKNYKGGSTSYNWNCKSDGYSILFDGEVSQRVFRLNWGVTDYIEIQYINKSIRFMNGNMDRTIENVHENFDLTGGGRQWTDLNNLEVYLWDNETDQAIFQLTDETGYQKLSETFVLKLKILENPKHWTLSGKIASNFNDEYLWTDLNEIKSQNPTQHNDFDDLNLSLYFTGIWDNLVFHSAISQTQIQSPYFSQSPDRIQFLFLGVTWIQDSFVLIMQDLIYSSIFPSDSRESMGHEINELTLGSRFKITPYFRLETGIVENLFTHGVINIDFSYYVSMNWELPG